MLLKISLFLLLLLPLFGIAKHLRSGEISYTPDPSGPPNTYIITITVYTNIGAGNPPDLPSLSFSPITNQNSTTFSFGDKTILAPIFRSNGAGEIISPTVKKNVFITKHTFPGNGTYIISLTANARNYGILNIPDSQSTSMYVESLLTINNKLKPISSPILSLAPIGDGCLNSIYKINPGAIDPDGDVLRFSLEKCKQSKGVDVPGYKFPNQLDPSGNSTFKINSKTGVILWDSPKDPAGEYNISLKIEKLRNGVVIGYVIRDMQVMIDHCDNNPPIIKPVADTCVEFGTNITYKVTSSDSDKDSLEFTTTGMPYNFTSSPANFIQDKVPKGSTSVTFIWKTNASHISKNPYQVYYKVRDFHPGSIVSLTDYESNFITITAHNPVKNVRTSVIKRGFNVEWDQSVYPQATGYNIYRSNGPSPFITDSCSMGVPFTSNYTLVGSVNGQTTPSYLDSNNGKGLTSGYTYCYIVTTVFANGAESAPSDPCCSPLMIPFIRVIQDTLTDCQRNTLTMDSTIIQFECADSLTIYNWSSTPELQLTNANKPDVSVNLNAQGLHFIKIVSTSGAYTDSAKIYIQVNPIPIPLIEFKNLGGIPNSVIFYNRSTDFVRAEWQIDGTKSSSLDSVLYSFDKNGYYRIYLKVYNRFGCSDTTSIVFRAVMKGVEMPNAFEPENQNAELNSFRPLAIGLQTYYFGVWDLWGNLVWSTDEVVDTRPGKGWNGTDSKGRKMPAQNYIWRMKTTFIDGTVWKGVKDHFGKLHTEGTFTLLR